MSKEQVEDKETVEMDVTMYVINAYVCVWRRMKKKEERGGGCIGCRM